MAPGVMINVGALIETAKLNKEMNDVMKFMTERATKEGADLHLTMFAFGVAYYTLCFIHEKKCSTESTLEYDEKAQEWARESVTKMLANHEIEEKEEKEKEEEAKKEGQ